MEDGRRVRGETKITASSGRIQQLFLDPPDVKPLPQTLEAMARADLITRQIPHVSTLAQLLAQQRCDATVAARVGAALAQFHNAGAYHADLNAHNILLDAAAVWVVDFDRGELRAPARGWRLANLARLQRSLLKLGAARDGEAAFERGFWNPLMAAYERSVSVPLAPRGSPA